MISSSTTNLIETLSKIPGSDRLICIVIPGKKYHDTVNALTEYVLNKKDDFWVYVTITKPFESFIRRFRNISAAGNIKYVDCISQAANVVRKDDRCSYVDSPVMLENIIMEIEDVSKRIPAGYGKYVVIDSLTTLTIYNDEEMVIEFFYQLVNKTAALQASIISLVIEEEAPEKFVDRISHVNDEIIKITDKMQPVKEKVEKEEIVKMEDWDREKDFFKENRI